VAETVMKMPNREASRDVDSKRDNFVRLAESRTVNAIKAIRIIGKLGNRNAYDYGDEDVRKIIRALTDEIESLKNRMKTTKPSDGVGFKL